jgi:hypothetical protein
VVLGRQVRDGRGGLGHPVELRDLAGEVLEHAPLQLRRDRRGRVLDVVQAAEVGAVELGRVEQHRQHRRHEHGVRDPLALDGGEHGGGVEARQQHLRGPDPCARDDVGGAGDVEHRADVQPALRLAVAGRHQVVQGVGQQVAVAEHHPLGPPGRAAGVRDRRQRARLHAGRRRGRARREILVGEAVVRAGPRGVEDQLPQAGAALAQGARDLEASLVDDEDLDAGVVDHEGQLIGGKAVVEVGDHAPERRHREPALEMRDRVGPEVAEARSLPQAELAECGPERADPRGELAVAERPLAVDDRDRVAVHERRALQRPAQVHRLSPRGRAA